MKLKPPAILCVLTIVAVLITIGLYVRRKDSHVNQQSVTSPIVPPPVATMNASTAPVNTSRLDQIPQPNMIVESHPSVQGLTTNRAQEPLGEVEPKLPPPSTQSSPVGTAESSSYAPGEVRGQYSSAQYAELRRDVDGLGSVFTDREIERLFSILHMRAGTDNGAVLKEIDALKNLILDRLIAQKNLPNALGSYLTEAYQDATWDNLWRNYVIQHFAPYYQARYGSAGGKTSGAEADTIRDVLWSAGSDSDPSIAASALIGWEELSRYHETFDRLRLKSRVATLAVSESTPAPLRIAAFQLAGELDATEVLSSAKAAAVNAPSIALRAAAINAIGALGSNLEAQWLEQFQQDGVPSHLQQAASLALYRISAQN